jgi:hypothetical protein
VSGANVVTTENSDWATNCPEDKVTAVQVGLAVAAASAGLVSAGLTAGGGAGNQADGVAAELAQPDGHAGAHAPEGAWVARMVNDIAVQFPHLTDAEAAEAIAAHIRRFWEPRMVSELAKLAGSADSSLTARASAAARRLGGRADQVP